MRKEFTRETEYERECLGDFALVGVRKLGVPCVVDRLIQQAVLQVLQERWDPTFSEHSYGFRPGRSLSWVPSFCCASTYGLCPPF